jgi:hypothetical protein
VPLIGEALILSDLTAIGVCAASSNDGGLSGGGNFGGGGSSGKW